MSQFHQELSWIYVYCSLVLTGLNYSEIILCFGKGFVCQKIFLSDPPSPSTIQFWCVSEPQTQSISTLLTDIAIAQCLQAWMWWTGTFLLFWLILRFRQDLYSLRSQERSCFSNPISPGRQSQAAKYRIKSCSSPCSSRRYFVFPINLFSGRVLPLDFRATWVCHLSPTPKDFWSLEKKNDGGSCLPPCNGHPFPPGL